MKRQFFTLLAGLLCLSGSVAQAAKVDTLSVRSNAMNKNVTVLTVRPDKAVGGEKCPVIYLLHGHGGNAFTWMTIKPDLPQIADREGIIFVCPDGKNSWYWDSPRNKDYRETDGYPVRHSCCPLRQKYLDGGWRATFPHDHPYSIL